MSAARRSGLGRGLDALLGGASEPKPPGQGTSAASAGARPPGLLPIDELRPNRFQPRGRFDEAGLEELAESIRTQGILQPIVVSIETDGSATIVAGERRWRAARIAGLREVPVVVREEVDDQRLLELALVENLQRTDLNPIEEAEAYELLRERFGLSQEEIGTRVGKGRPTITNTLRLLRLPEPVQDLLREGRLTAGQARPLLGIGDRSRQLELARRIAREGLSARQIEALAQQETPRKRAGASRPGESDPHLRAAQERLVRALQTKVEIRQRGERGTVRIHYHSQEELMRIYDRLVEQPARDRPAKDRSSKP
ncbi:MAG TPA: ParB/RepB/Spo0J family partition protein [Thermoanaerobaculia bacterium]|nr:ParB/RepB/Spo0J family partition protein [Thermoanaerobaculia bacterium]